MKIDAFLFDLDGVLIDSEGGYTGFWSEMGRIYAPDVPGLAAKIKGMTLDKIFDAYFPGETVRADIRRRLDAYEASMPLAVYPGVLDLLRELRGKGIKTAVVTSSNRAKMDRLYASLPELATLIDITVTDEDVTRSKPDPEPYLTGAARLGVSPEKCAVVEDSLNGLRAGRASGAYVIGITTTNPPETVKPLCDVTLDATADIATLCWRD